MQLQQEKYQPHYVVGDEPTYNYRHITPLITYYYLIRDYTMLNNFDFFIYFFSLFILMYDYLNIGKMSR